MLCFLAGKRGAFPGLGRVGLRGRRDDERIEFKSKRWLLPGSLVSR